MAATVALGWRGTFAAPMRRQRNYDDMTWWDPYVEDNTDVDTYLRRKFRQDIPDKVGIGRGKGSERTAKRILELLVDGPMRPSALREAVGIRSPIHFSRYYLRPLMEKGMIERTDPDSPKSPRQEYKLA